MAAAMGKPVLFIVLMNIALLVNIVVVLSKQNDRFTEEMFIKSLNNGNVLFHFQFTTLWNASIAETSTFTHYRLFPKAFGEVLSKYKVQELHLTQTQGMWQYERWGYAPEGAPPGVELWVWFQPGIKNLAQNWSELVNALSGLFCASLNFMDTKSTVIPSWSFRPMGLANQYYSFDSRFMRYSALPREVVCTENLTPWKKLLPCESEAGLGSLFNSVKLFDSSFHSLGIHVRPVCQDSQCNNQGIELKQTMSVVFDVAVQNAGYQNWNMRSLFEKPLTNKCPLASLSKVYVDTSIREPLEYTFTLHPESDSEVRFTRGGEKSTYAVYDIGRHTQGGKSFPLRAQYNTRVKYGDTEPPPLYAHRYVTGYGLQRGGITCTIYNTLNSNLTVIYMETIPWFLRLYFNSIKIVTHGTITVKPYKTHYIPGKDRSRPHQLELVFRLRPDSVTTISMEFERAFLKWTEYPPDANHGFYVNSAVISTMLPVAGGITSPPQNSSTFGDSMTDQSQQFFLRLHTEALLVSLPTPDFSMPYNVICLACTVVAIAFGSIHNLTTRRFVAIDPEKKKPGIVQKLKNLFTRKKKEAEGSKNVEDTSDKKSEIVTGSENEEESNIKTSET